jgi:hypothetical protein
MGFAHSCVPEVGWQNEPPSEDEETGEPPERCATRSDIKSVMMPSASETDPVARTLSDDDIRGVCRVYGALLPHEVEGSVGGCSLAPGTGGERTGLGALVLAAASWLSLRRRRRPPPRGRRAVVTVVGAAGLTLLSMATPASAYVRTQTQGGQPAYWNHPVLPLTVHVGQPPAGLTGEQILEATAAAAASWSRAAVSCSQLDIRVKSAPGADALTRADGQANVIFRREEWCRKPRPAAGPCYDPSMVALTSVFIRKSDGHIMDADIEVNAVSNRWSTAPPDPESPPSADGVGAGAQDLQGALTHELGHLLGFEHSCLLPGESPRTDDRGQPSPTCTLREDPGQTVMVASVPPGQPLPRALAAEDARALCEVYPAVSRVVTGDHAGCTLAANPARSPGLSAALVLAALLALARPHRRR